MLDLLVDLRERLRAEGLPLWEAALPYLDEIAELSLLSKWLLLPPGSGAEPPPPSLRHAARASGVDGAAGAARAEVARALAAWEPRLDEELVRYVDSQHGSAHGGGAGGGGGGGGGGSSSSSADRPGSALTLRPALLASLSHDGAPSSSDRRALQASAAEARCARFVLIQRFNALLAHLAPLVHSSREHEARQTLLTPPDASCPSPPSSTPRATPHAAHTRHTHTRRTPLPTPLPLPAPLPSPLPAAPSPPRRPACPPRAAAHRRTRSAAGSASCAG